MAAIKRCLQVLQKKSAACSLYRHVPACVLVVVILVALLAQTTPGSQPDTNWGDCLSCHTGYVSSLPKLSLLRRANLGQDIGRACQECHDLAFLSLPRSDWSHPVRPVGAHLDCIQCHVAVEHGTGHPPPVPIGDYVAGCFECHSDTQQALAKYSRHSLDARTSCRGCHPAHETLRAGLPLDLLPRRIQRAWSGAYDYERSNAACLACHGESDLFINLTRGFVTYNTVNYHQLHVQQGRGLCIDCHDAHGSQRAHLIRARLLSGDSLSFVEEARGANCTTMCHGVEHRSLQYINRLY